MRAALSIKRRHRRVVGVDLAGSPQRNTGICTLKKNNITFCTIVHTDQEIVDYVQKENPALIAMDAPLNLPPGRKSIEDKTGDHLRPCDRELLRRGIRFFPITLGPMRLLSNRGIHLKRVLTRHGYAVIEVYPGAAQDIWHTGRKQNGLSKLRYGLQKLGVKGLNKKMNGDELDAVTAALVGYLFLHGKAEVLGDYKRGAIVIPYTRGSDFKQRSKKKKVCR
jgi:predicted nuclease with RNAse H fold